MKHIPVPPALIDFIKTHQRFFLVSHIDPDGDCLTSSLALGKCLTEMGKEVKHLNSGPFARKEIKIFEPFFSQHVPSITTDTAVILLDCSSAGRVGNIASSIQNVPTAVIDHHSNGGDYGDVRFINATSPSTSILIQQVIESLDIPLSRELAELIFFGFATDTGFFRFLGENSHETFTLLAKLVEAGASPQKIHSQITGSVSLASRKHLGILLQRTESYHKGHFLYTWATYNDIKLLEPDDRDSASLYQQLMNVCDVEILLVLWEKTPGKTVGNIRTTGRIDAGELAAKYGGGGHVQAAGFSIEKSIQEIFSTIKDEIALFF